MKDRLETAPRFILFSQLTRIGFLEIIPLSARAPDQGLLADPRREPDLLSWTGAGPARRGPVPSSEGKKLADDILDDSGLADDPLSALARNAFLRDCAAEESAATERNERQPQVFHLLLDGLNIVQTYFYKFSFPEQFGDVDQERIERYGPVIESYYEFYDGLIGKYLTGLKEDEILVVYSPFGVEPLPLWKRFVERLLGDPDVSAYHELAPGRRHLFLRQGGPGRPSPKGPSGSSTSHRRSFISSAFRSGGTWTGSSAARVFGDEFIAENPIIYISSYEEFEIRPPEQSGTIPEDALARSVDDPEHAAPAGLGKEADDLL